MTSAEAVANAANVLDKLCPEWFHNINLDTLDPQDIENCPLTQTFGSFSVGMMLIGENGTPYYAHQFGDQNSGHAFASTETAPDWRIEVERRLNG